MKEKHTYPFIRAWGHQLGSFQYYIGKQIEQATADNAPQDAVYRKDDGAWVRLGDLDDYLQRRLQMWAEQ